MNWLRSLFENRLARRSSLDEYDGGHGNEVFAAGGPVPACDTSEFKFDTTADLAACGKSLY